MRLTIIFIHEGELMNFQLEYLPSLDAGDEKGIWLLDENKVVTSWRLFNEFRDEKNYERRRKMLHNLRKISRYEIK
jgi:hypothetical protein